MQTVTYSFNYRRKRHDICALLTTVLLPRRGLPKKHGEENGTDGGKKEIS